MKLWPPVTILLLLIIAGPAPAGEANPYLHLLQRSEALRRVWAPRQLTPMGLFEQGPGPLRVPALVRTTDAAATAAALRAAGGHAGRAVGDILPVRAAPAALIELAAREEVVRLEAAPPRRPLLDLSRPALRADAVEAGEGLPLPIDGTGAIAALVDTGIDYAHTDFLSPSGRTRVRALWDQAFGSCDGCQPPPDQAVGVVCERDSLVRGKCNSPDFIGHGTHVAATMAGSGETFRGMAPGADLMGVASIDFGLLVESVGWLFDQAEARGQPMVVNLSLGGHYGPHDGSSLESQALSELTGPGRIVMASAGNEGSDLIHLGYDPAGDSGKTLFRVFSGFDVSAALFTIWMPADAELSFTIGVQADGVEIDETEPVAADGSRRSFQLADGATGLGRVQFEPAAALNPDNGKRQLDIAVEPADAAYDGNPSGYTWYIEASGDGAFDAWSAASGFVTPPASFSASDADGLIPGDNRKSVGMPAVAAGVIAVASWATRSRWVDIEGQTVNHIETTVDDISFFSSRGPSAAPEHTGPKPYITAPGEYIVAAQSNSSAELEPGTRIDADAEDENGHVAMRGTSMSCPHAAGVVALLLQVDPTLDPDGVRAILAASAQTDAHTGSDTPNPTWGHGKIDAWEAVALALGVGRCQADLDCVEGWRCGDAGRCQQKSSGGCGCAGAGPPAAPGALGLLAAFALLAAARRRG